MRIFVRSPAHLECLFMQRNTSRSRPVLRLRTLTFQADCGSIKELEYLQKRILDIIFPGSEYVTNLIIANVEALSHDHSYSYSFSSDGHRFRGALPLGPLWICQWSTLDNGLANL